MLALPQKEQYSNLPEPSLRLSVMVKTSSLFFVPHTTTQMPFSAQAAYSVVPPWISIAAQLRLGINYDGSESNRPDRIPPLQGGKEAIALGITFNLF